MFSEIGIVIAVVGVLLFAYFATTQIVKRYIFTWLKSKYSEDLVRHELTYWGPYGAMAGLSGYKQNGSWKLGFYHKPEKRTSNKY